jgi:hypothetical protein
LDIFCRPWLDITKCKWSFLHQPLHFVSMHGWANLYTISKKYTKRTLKYYMFTRWS